MSPPPSTATTATTALTTPPEPLPTTPGGASIKLRQGTYIGATIPANPDTYPKAVDAFLGIPYARSTADENRFRPAVPLPDSTSTFQAAAYGHACLGANSGRPEGEDCLNVNVFRPQSTERVPGEVYGVAKASHRLPVVIYVHGGGFNAGHGGERNMASFVSWAKPDIVAVSFNYRVGAFGFLPSALTAREGLLNLGLKDQQALFAWVQANIAEFGGDPDNVTIMGLSAGAHSIGHHLMYYSRSSSVPFAKAILESGATTARATFYPTHHRHLIQFREFLVAAGIEGVPESSIFPTLRTLPAATILKASKALWNKYEPSVTWPFQPVIDGPNSLSNSSHSNTSVDAVIPDLPLLSWQQGRHLSIPVLTGFNTNEGTLFIPEKANTTADFRSFFSALIPGFSPADLDALEALYPDPVTDASSPYKAVPEGKGAQWTRLDAAYSHYAYICPVLQTAHFLSTYSPSASNPSFSNPVYVYRYAAASRWGTANHGDEAPVVAHDMLNRTAAAARPGLRKVADAMHAAWVNFVVSPAGDPNPVSGQAGGWPAFVSPFGGRGKGEIVVFGEGNDERWTEKGGKSAGTPVGLEALTEWELERCRFWWDRVELSEGVGKRLDRGRL
ncbi:alpha/beta-hydrolase [Coniochaeta ligniaria NRRL 30616]|uniref:Carboxylic ester hydrolase n=1 Tax=Coniochaeta ligniaria NRRL 30616 TaxID=1408157 RepID=A0A1J7IJP7_9PEZI|nr:alpha/beta-hydrolase [Coniochaeta ligniaria NRRL 30616]